MAAPRGWRILAIEVTATSDRGVRRRFLLGAALCLGLAATGLAEQPRTEKALRHLQQAKSELTAARSDKGGHRDKGLDLTDKAINQVQAGIEYAKTRRH